MAFCSALGWIVPQKAGVGREGAMASMEPFSRHLDAIFANVRDDIMKQHEHHMTVQRLRMRSLLGCLACKCRWPGRVDSSSHGVYSGKSTEFSFRLDRPPDTLRTPEKLRRMQTWDSERSGSARSARSRGSKTLESRVASPSLDGKKMKTLQAPELSTAERFQHKCSI